MTTDSGRGRQVDLFPDNRPEVSLARLTPDLPFVAAAVGVIAGPQGRKSVIQAVSQPLGNWGDALNAARALTSEGEGLTPAIYTISPQVAPQGPSLPSRTPYSANNGRYDIYHCAVTG